MPPIEVHGTTTDAGATCDAIFPATDSYGLRQVVRVRFVLHVVDYGDSSIQVSLEARVGTAPATGVLALLFEGVLELGRLRATLDEAICKVLVHAQDAFEAGARDCLIEFGIGTGG